MLSEIDVCSILNIKEIEWVEKQKVNIEMIQHIAKSKKTKNVSDRKVKNIKKLERSLTTPLKKMDRMKK